LPPQLTRLSPAVGLALLLLAAAVVRLPPVLRVDFPRNDGGFFVVMAEEIRAADFALPAYTSYNGLRLPFAYPPLGLYAAAGLAAAHVAPVLDVVRVLPAVISVAIVAAFYLLARATLVGGTATWAATAGFALLPRTWEWMIMGGGLTRAPGFLFAVLALALAWRLFQEGGTRLLVLTTVCASLTVLSHLEKTWFLLYSALLLWLAVGRSRRSAVHGLLVVAGTLLLTSPWWATVLARHGPAPYLAAASAGGGMWYNWRPLLEFRFTDEPLLPILAVLALFGGIICLADRRPLLPLWIAVIFLVQPRNAFTVATVPLALLIGIAADRLLLRDVRAAPALAAVTAAYVLASSYVLLRTSGLFRVLPHEERTAMRWVAAEVPQGSAFLVLSWLPFWEDRSSEWFPVLARRPSRGTVQATEWLGKGEFLRRWRLADSLQACGGRKPECLDAWSAQAGTTFTHVYVREGCCGPLLAALRQDAGYAAVYEGPGAVIFARRSDVSTARR
jgi:hypothetical protein